jgi:hypothetical protein
MSARRGSALASALVWLFLTAMPARAEQPAAIVEAVQAPSSGIQAFDFVAPGQVIVLGADGKLTLGYLASCQRERIEGGRVMIGTDQSTVEGGTIKRLKVACDGGALQLGDQAQQQSAVVVFREGPTQSKDLPKPQVVLYGVSPVVKLDKAGAELEIKRLDQPAQPVTIAMTHAAEDLSRLGVSLAPGGLYAARAGDRAIVFKIDPAAIGGRGPVVGRLLSF